MCTKAELGCSPCSGALGTPRAFLAFLPACTSWEKILILSTSHMPHITNQIEIGSPVLPGHVPHSNHILPS